MKLFSPDSDEESRIIRFDWDTGEPAPAPGWSFSPMFHQKEEQSMTLRNCLSMSRTLAVASLALVLTLVIGCSGEPVTRTKAGSGANNHDHASTHGGELKKDADKVRAERAKLG